MAIATKAESVQGWFATKGITPETMADFGIYLSDDGAVNFPYGDNQSKKRYGIPTGERSFRWGRGADPVLFNRRDLGKRNLFLCEGETDTMRLRQEIGANPDVGVLGLPGIETWNEGMATDLRAAEQVWVILDNDLDYKVAGRVDLAFRTIRQALGSKAKRIVLPRGINDLCEFFEDYSIDSLRLLVERQPRAGESRFRVVDLNVAPTPPRWIIEGMLVRGDVHLIIGEPNIGKSWITMAMAVAVAGGKHDFLGHAVVDPGRVLYFDEENPEDLAIERFSRLGMNAEVAENLRFIKDAGIRLDKEPDSVIDEAMAYEPTLIILDSLTRLHTEDENSAGAMSVLFNNAIKPLAREVDAAVVVIHHTNKSESSSSFKRSRGSVDITAFPDTAYDVMPNEDGSIKFKNFKARRKAQAETRFISLVDKPDGSIEVIGLTGYSNVF